MQKSARYWMLCMIASCTMLTGCLDFTGKHAAEREALKKKLSQLQSDFKKIASKFDERDYAKQSIMHFDRLMVLYRRAQKEMSERQHE